jgi:hypothetical protein
MPKAKQLNVSCENRASTLAHVARVLGDAKVSVLAFCVAAGSGGDVHLIVDDPNKARKALSALGLSYEETDVLYQELPNVAGALGYFAGKLASKEINVTSGWGTTLKGFEDRSCCSWSVRFGKGGPRPVDRVEGLAKTVACLAPAPEHGLSATAGHALLTGDPE